jgi:hypothetical protein
MKTSANQLCAGLRTDVNERDMLNTVKLIGPCAVHIFLNPKVLNMSTLTFNQTDVSKEVLKAICLKPGLK